MLTPIQSRQHCAAALLAVILLCGCQSPFLVFAGSELTGTERTTDSFAFAETHATLQLEVNPEAPYSVILRTTVINGELYVDAAEARRWGRYLEENPRVRIKLGDSVYPAIAEPVTDAAITDRFLPGRTVYRMVPSGR